MAVAPFGEWLPDQVAYANPGVFDVLNVLPAPGGHGYVPFPSIVDSELDLPGEPLGWIMAELPGDVNYSYVGTRTGIYMLGPDGWRDVSKAGGYSLGEGDRWEFVQFQQRIIAACGGAAPTQVAFIGGGSFADLATSTRKPRGRRLGLVNGWPVLGHTIDDTDGEQPNRLWWPQLVQVPRPENWDPDLTTQANYTVSMPQAGDGGVLYIAPGPVGIVICRRAVYRMRYVNLPGIFDFDRVAGGRGAICAGACVYDGSRVYFLDHDGFYMTDGESVQPIGHGKVDQSVRTRLNVAEAEQITSGVIQDKSAVVWLLPLDGASTPSHALCYSWKEDRFTLAKLDVAVICETAPAGMALDVMPWAERILDAEPWGKYAWDSKEFSGGQRAATAISKTGDVGYLTGPGLPASIETLEIAPNEPFVTETTEVRPVVDGPRGAEISVGTRNSLSDDVFWGPYTTLNMIGYAPVRAHGIYLRGRIKLPAGFRQAIGISFEPKRAGKR